MSSEAHIGAELLVQRLSRVERQTDPNISTFVWGVVTQVSPLRVRLESDPGSTPLDLTPESMVSGLRVNDRVRCELVRTQGAAMRVIVHGPSDGGSGWTSWTPSVVATGGGLNLGSTPTLMGAYTRIGKTVHWRVMIQSGGSGVAAGTGVYEVTFPVAVVPGSAFQIVAAGWMYGASSFVPFVVDIAGAGSTTARLVRTDVPGSLVDASIGFTTGGHVLTFAGSYEGI